MGGGTIERRRDPVFRQAFEQVLQGVWRKHDPYHLKGRIGSKTSTEGQLDQASIFRTFQGWLAVSDTVSGEGALKVFPDILLSTAYIIFRPFFSPKADVAGDAGLNLSNWNSASAEPDRLVISDASLFEDDAMEEQSKRLREEAVEKPSNLPVV